MPKQRSPRGLSEQCRDRRGGESQGQEKKTQVLRRMELPAQRSGAEIRPGITMRGPVVLIAVVAGGGCIRGRREVGVVVVRVSRRVTVVRARRIRQRHHRRVPGKRVRGQQHEGNEKKAQHEQGKREPLPQNVLPCRQLLHGNHTRAVIESARSGMPSLTRWIREVM